MHVLIDCTNKIAIAKHAEYMALAALAYIQFANIECTIVSLANNRNFAQFDDEELVKIGGALGIRIPNKKQGGEYGQIIKKVKAAIESAENLELPFGTDALMYQANAIHPDCDLPRNFLPPDERHQLKVAGWPGRWAMDPQLNRRRKDSTYGSMFGTLNKPPEQGPHTKIIDLSKPMGRKISELATDGQNAPRSTPAVSDKVDARESAHIAHDEESNMSVTAEFVAAEQPARKSRKKADAVEVKAAPKAPAKKAAAPTKPASPKAAAKKAPAAPKKSSKVEAAKATTSEKQNDITRPRPGGISSQIWDIADALLAKSGKGNPPAFLDVQAIAEKKKLEINPGTLRTQYGNWRRFNGITGRV